MRRFRIDWDFIEDFLITFRYFMEPMELLTRLIVRYAYEVNRNLFFSLQKSFMVFVINTILSVLRFFV